MKDRAESKIRNKKIGIALMEYIITLGCLLLAFVMISGKRIEQTSSYAKPEEVSKYKVINDEYLTRVRPLTEYNTFKEIAESTIGKRVVVYKDATKTEEVQDGIIKSGMVVVTENEDAMQSPQEKIYEVGVLGDFNANGQGDGDCTVEELTRMIRHVVEIEKLKNAGEILSADFNQDGVIDVVDITMCIRYIVYEELPTDVDVEPEPDPEPVNKPQINIIGEGNENWYKSDVKVEIVEDGENIEKTLTKFEMTLKGQETREQTTSIKKILIREEGNYKITAQSYGTNGTKSEAEIKEINIDKTNPELTLSRENIDSNSCKIIINASDDNIIKKYSILQEDGEIIKSEILNEKEINKEITINNDGKYKAILEDLAGNITEEEIEIKGVSTKYQVIFKNDDGTVISEEEYSEGEELRIPENPSKEEDNTYTYEFTGWSPEVEETVTENKEYTATYREVYKNYTVTFKDEDGSIIETKNNYHYGDKMQIPENPIKEQDETYTYEFKGWKNSTGEMAELTEDTEVIANEEYTAVYESKYREYTVTFWNEDKTQVIARRIFTAEDKEIEEPVISQDREGYIGYWTYYEIELKDIDVQLYYVQEKTNGDSLTETIDGIKWVGTYQDGKAIDVHYNNGELGETVKIPATLEGYPVKIIFNSGSYGVNIFYGNSQNINKITIPNTVTSIGNNAFYNCGSLTNIELPNVTNIGNEAFFNCGSLTNIELPSVTNMGDFAFYNCDSLTNIELPNVTNMGDFAFNNCDSLTNIELPSVTNIGDFAFGDCGSLTNIELPNVTSIGNSTFNYCSSLTDIYIGNDEQDVTLGEYWNNNAYVHFGDCTHSITINNEITRYHIEEVSNNLVDGRINCGETYQFKVLDSDGNVVKNAPIKLTSQGPYTYSGDVVEEITKLEDGIYAIERVYRNKTIRIARNDGEKFQAEDENGITWNYTYQDGNATKVYYESGELGTIVNIPYELDGYPVVQIASNSAGKSIFKEKAQNIKNIIIPNSIIDIGHFAFYGCNGLTNIEIPSSVTNIDYNAFSDCRNLSDYYIDNDSGKYSYNFNYNNGYVHYKDCKHTVSFNIDSENIKVIAEDTGDEIYNTSVNCGDTIKFRLLDTTDSSIVYNKKLYLKTQAKFRNQEEILEIIFPDENGVYTLENINRNKTIIENLENGMKIIAKDENDITWQFTYQDGRAEDVHYYDGELGENVQIPSELYGYSVTCLRNSSEYGGENGNILTKENWASNDVVKTVIIPNTVITIGNYAFRDCVKISTINIPSSVTKIGSGVFYGCISLANIYIDNLEENIELSDDINQYGYVHYSDCKHDIAFEKYTNEEIELQTVGEKGQDGHIECREDYKFRLLDENGNPVTTEKVLVRYAGLENEIDENERDYYDRVRRLLDNSSNMFASEEEGIRELQVGEDGTYTVEKVHRNITIIVGSYQTTDENNITWNYSIKDGKAINVYYAGGELGETVTIPSELDGHQVESLYNKEESGSIFGKAEDTSVIKNVVLQDGITKIDKYAFYKLGSLETITIPDTVTEIGYASFYNCEGLKEINIPTSVTKIDRFAFTYCISLTNIEIPDTVIEIGKAAFSTCKNLESIRLPSNLLAIEDTLFVNCEKLNNVQIPEGVTTIGIRAFYNCSSIEELVIPDTVTEIKESAFYNCNSLQTIKLSNSITSIENQLFGNCYSLTNIIIPEGINIIKEYSFGSCRNIEKIEIPSSVTKIEAAFSGCTNLKDIYINNDESGIDINAYDGKPWYPWYNPVNAQIHYKDCTHSVKLRKYMEDSTEIETEIEGVDNESIPCRSNYQFKLVKDGEVIKNKTITITELGTKKYYDVEKEIEPNEEGIYTIENISRNCIIVIGERYQYATDENGITWEYEYENGKATNVHYYSGELGTNIEIPGTLNGYSVVNLYKENSDGNPVRIFGDDYNIYETITIPEGVTSIGEKAFDNYYNLSTIELPNSMNYIGRLAFENCSDLQSINLPDNIKEIGKQAFYYCSSLENIELPSELTVIEEDLFNNCNNLKNITIKNNVKEIKKGAFSNCSSLEELYIPEGVTTIENGIFNHCHNLSTITIPDSLSAVYVYCCIEDTLYYRNLPDGEFYMGKVLYKYKGEMPENTTIIVKEGTEIISERAFEGYTNLIGIELPDTVTVIGECAFKECKNLSYVEMPKNVNYIGGGAFQDCTSLSQIVIWKNVEKLRDRAFERWTNEQTINFEVEEVQEGWASDWNKNCKAQIVFGYTGE